MEQQLEVVTGLKVEKVAVGLKTVTVDGSC